MTRRPSLLRLAVLVVPVCAIAFGLGLWQLQRHAAKLKLIAEISARATAKPQALSDPAQWASLRPEDYEYRHVTVEGVFSHDEEVLIFRAEGGGTTGIKEPGYDVLTPLRTPSGAYVIINRGFLPQSVPHSATIDDADGTRPTRVTGLMRAPEPRNMFTPKDDFAHGRAFTSDPVAIAAHFGLRPAAPFSIDADASADPHAWPKAGTTELRIPDNHLGYALTWFGLAATAAAVFGAYAWRQRRAAT